MRVLDLFKQWFKHHTEDSNTDRSIAVGSEAMHDAGLTDQEATGAKLEHKDSDRREIFIKHNQERPEDKIRRKQKQKTPV